MTPGFQTLVLVDADPHSRGALAFGFEREGVTVHATAEANGALALITVERPPMVVVAASEDGIDVVEFVFKLRGMRGPQPAVLVVGENDDDLRRAVMAAGADEFVGRPSFIRDIVTLARLTVGLRIGGGELEARLADFSLFFLTRAIAAARRSAVLFVERERRSADLRFADGELIAARVGHQTGSNAFLHLLLWEDAAIHLRFGDANSVRKIHKPVERLLEDGQRFVAEFEAMAERVGGRHVVFAADHARFEAVRRQVPSEVVPVLQSFDGVRSLIDVVEDSPFKPFDTIMITYRLSEMKAILRQGVTPVAHSLAAPLHARERMLGSPSLGDPSVAVADPTGRIMTGMHTPSSAPSVPQQRAQPVAAPQRKQPAPPPREPEITPVRPVAPVARPVAQPPVQVAPAPTPVPIAASADSQKAREVKRPVPIYRPAPEDVDADATVRIARLEAEIDAPPLPPPTMKLGIQAPRAPLTSLADTLSALRPVGALHGENGRAARAPRAESARAADARPANVDTGKIPRVEARPSPSRSSESGRVPRVAVTEPRPVAAPAASHTPRIEARGPSRGESSGRTRGDTPRSPKVDTGRTPKVDSGRVRKVDPARVDSGRHPKVDFTELDEDFFQREADLFRVDTVESFDDLDDDAPPDNSASKPTRRWFGLGGDKDSDTLSTREPARKPKSKK